MNTRFTVTGNPIPKQSFRYSKQRSYQPARLVDWQNMVGWAAKQHAPAEPEKGTFVVRLRFYRKTKHRVDLDNLSKAVLDALEGIFWIDDTQVTDLFISKRYDPDNPRVEVELWKRRSKKSSTKSEQIK